MVINRWLHSVLDAGRRLLPESITRSGDRDALSKLEALCKTLISSRGEAMGTALASEALKAYHALSVEQRTEFFFKLLANFGARETDVRAAIENYLDEPSGDRAIALHHATEAPRQMLFRRLNMAPKGTYAVVKMRSDLLRLLKQHSDLKSVDADLQHLMISWFNPGFLELKEINWRTSALVLEKLIAYEAVHSMTGWEDLQRRLAEDRRCFAFFHPAVPDEPLIFVEVALTSGIANSVDQLLNEAVDPSAAAKADTAIFYSISDCQPGLKGISFGNFLIKQVVFELKQELPNLQRFSTLSPIPGFSRWLFDEQREQPLEDAESEQFAPYFDPDSEAAQDPAAITALMKLSRHYLKQAKRDLYPFDPVARFHLRNGAALGACHWSADSSARGKKQSAGIMVNYIYEIDQVEERHEQFVNHGEIAVIPRNRRA